jgi:signal transduction histidine kinase
MWVTGVAKAPQVTGAISMRAPSGDVTPPQPLIMRILVRPAAYRHPRAYGGACLAAGLWLFILGVILCSYGFWWGALLIAVAVLELWIAYHLLVAPLPQRVRELEQTRAHVVDDSAARLRRIERDLHRGAKEAITELRDLARGIHPSVLDQGLGPALSTLAARSDLPVELVADLPERPSAAIETIAYFCAAELLANVAKHSGARHATLEAVHVPGLLRLRVSDDGTGGARTEALGGLAGLAERVRTVDGRLRISSPPDGPTVVAVELPSHA